MLYHYFLVWLSIITSPKGHQLDIWLVIILIMDCVPILMSLYHTAQYVVRSQTDPWQYDPHSVFWSLTSSMRSWSPAYQLNSLIMHYVEGCLIKHVYILFMFTLTVTQLHRWIVSNLYCVRLWWRINIYFGIAICNWPIRDFRMLLKIDLLVMAANRTKSQSTFLSRIFEDFRFCNKVSREWWSWQVQRGSFGIGQWQKC